MKILTYILGAAAVLFLLYLLVCELLVHKLMKKFVCTSEPGALGIDYGEGFKKMQRDAAAWRENHPCETVEIVSEDGLKLSGRWWDFGFKKTIVYIHGYGNDGSQVGLMSGFIVNTLHANILAPDCRAHGNSQGDYIGFGWPDRLDVLQWIKWLNERQGEDKPVALMGLSMGAACVLSVAGEKLPPNVKAICADSAYSSLWELFLYLLHDKFHLPRFPFIAAADRFFRKNMGFSIREACPAEAVRKASVPILFVHGENDHFIPVSMCRELTDAYQGEKEIFIVPGAGHAMSAMVAPQEYSDKFVGFLKKHIPDE